MNSVAGDDLACTDEIKVYEDEGEEDEQVKSSENLTEDKVGLVIESEEQVPRLFDLFGRNGSSILKMPWPTDPRFASYFLPGYPAALAAVMAAMRSSASPVCSFPTTGGAAAATGCHNDYSPGAPGGGFLSGLASSSTSPTASAPPHSNSTFYTPPWEPQGPLATNASAFGSPTATGGSGDGYMGAGGGGGSESQRDSAVDDRGQAAFSGNRIPPFLSNPFNPSMPFYHNPLHGLFAAANTSGTHEVLRKSPVDRLSDGGLELMQNSAGLKSEMGTYTPPTHTTSHPMGRGVGGSDFWQSGQTTSLKPDPSSTSTTATTPSSSSSSSLYAAVMAAAVASWSGQSASTATPATDTLATGVPTSRNDPYSKTNFSSCCEDVAIKRTKSQDAAKTPYSPSMFAAAAAAHMHFLSAAAAAASFTSSLPTVQTNTAATSTANPSAASTTTGGIGQGALALSPAGLGRKAPSDAWVVQLSATASKPSESGRQNFRKPNCDPETMASSPQDEASSEPDGGRLLSRLKKAHIKKPLNAFMLFMKEMRPRVQEECTLKESAAINQILGKKWHELSRAEQTKYYEMARQAKELHQRLYPGWSARDNYAYHARRRHRRSRRPFPHHRSFVHKPTSSSSTINAASKTSPIGRLRSSSFHEDRKALELPQKVLERPHSTNDVYSPSIERRVASLSPLSSPPPPPPPPPPPQSPMITNRVSERQQQQIAMHSSSPPRPSLPLPPPTQSQLPAHTAAFVSPLQAPSQPPPQALAALSRPTPNLANNALTMSACSAFEHHSNQAVHHHQQQQQPLPQQFLQMPSQRTFGYSPSSSSTVSTSAATAVSMYASAQGQGRGGTMSRASTGYWGYHGPQTVSHQSTVGVKRNPYLTAAAAMNSDSVAAVAAVAAMAVGELSGGSMKKCRARFGLEHQNLWCKPCRRKKKCIRFISENEIDDYMPQYHPYHAHSAAAAAAAAAAVAFNHHHHHPHQQPPQAQHHPYGVFTASRRHTSAGAGGAYSGPAENPSSAHLRKQSFIQASVSPFGNGFGAGPQRPFTRQPIPQHISVTAAAATNSAYAHPSLGSSYKRPFPMPCTPRQHQQAPREFTSVSNAPYAGSGNGVNYWGSSSRSSTNATAACFSGASTRFSASEVILSQGDPKSLAPLLRETQGSNPSPPTYPPPKMNNFPHTQQGTTLAVDTSTVNSTTTTATIRSIASTNGGGSGDLRLKREAPPLSFGVADVMGFRSGEESVTLNTMLTATSTSTSTSNTAVYRGNASPSTSSCPLRSSPELE